MIESSGMVQTKTATLFQDGCCLLMIQQSVGVTEKVAPAISPTKQIESRGFKYV